MSSLFAVSQASYCMNVPFLTCVLLTPELQFTSTFTTVTVLKSEITQPLSSLPYVWSFELPGILRERLRETKTHTNKKGKTRIFEMKVWRVQIVQRLNSSRIFF